MIFDTTFFWYHISLKISIKSMWFNRIFWILKLFIKENSFTTFFYAKYANTRNKKPFYTHKIVFITIINFHNIKKNIKSKINHHRQWKTKKKKTNSKRWWHNSKNKTKYEKKKKKIFTKENRWKYINASLIVSVTYISISKIKSKYSQFIWKKQQVTELWCDELFIDTRRYIVGIFIKEKKNIKRKIAHTFNRLISMEIYIYE